MKSKFIRIVNLIVAAAVFVFAIGYVFAWLAESRKQAEQKFNGSSGQTYFAGGNGGENDPFIINNKYHMYNLAWLQNTGKLTERYYFALGDNVEIDDDNFWLPPIGTDDNPFVGDFNGNGYTISGLKITTDKSKLRGVPQGFKTFSNAVGLFGMTKKQDGATEGAKIHNFILENPIVEVATKNAPYATSELSNKDMVAGLAIGYLNEECRASSIGILSPDGSDGAQLIMNRANGYSTFNSIIGALGNNVTSSVTGGGHGTGGSGNAFGASFDVETFSKRLYLMEANRDSGEGNVSSFLPIGPRSSNDYPVLLAGEKMPFAVSSPVEEATYTGKTARETVADNNIGYSLGSETKLNKKNIKLREALTQTNDSDLNWKFADGTLPSKDNVPMWFYTKTPYVSENSGYNSKIAGVNAITIEQYQALPQGIKNLLPENVDKYVKEDISKNIFQPNDLTNSYIGQSETFETIRLSDNVTYETIKNYGVTSVKQWSYHGQISWMGKTYGEGFRGADGYAVDENGDYILVPNQYNPAMLEKVAFNKYNKGIALPNNAVWFKPSQSGTLKFVMYSEKSGEGFSLMKIKRGETKRDPTSDNFFDVASDSADMGFTWERIIMQKLPAYVLFYYEYEVTPEDIEMGNVEFILCEQGDGGAQFVYLDMGASASDDVSTVDPTVNVSAVDFIYEGVEIAKEEKTINGAKVSVGDFILSASGTPYTATRTSVYFENLNKILAIVYVRPNGGENASGNTLIVTVTPSADGEIKQTQTTALIQ